MVCIFPKPAEQYDPVRKIAVPGMSGTLFSGMCFSQFMRFHPKVDRADTSPFPAADLSHLKASSVFLSTPPPVRYSGPMNICPSLRRFPADRLNHLAASSVFSFVPSPS